MGLVDDTRGVKYDTSIELSSISLPVNKATTTNHVHIIVLIFEQREGPAAARMPSDKRTRAQLTIEGGIEWQLVRPARIVHISL